MKSLTHLLNRISNWKSLAIFLIAYVFFAGYILKNTEIKINDLSDKTVGVIDLTIGFNPQKTLDMVAAYSDAARIYYARAEMTTDVLYPIIYAFLFGIILTLLYKKKSIAWINVLPFLTMLMDFVENVNIIILLKTFPHQSMLNAIFCEIFKLLKWISFGAIIILILYGLLTKLIDRKQNS